jgi:hypothetical protein
MYYRQWMAFVIVQGMRDRTSGQAYEGQRQPKKVGWGTRTIIITPTFRERFLAQNYQTPLRSAGFATCRRAAG